MAASQPTRSSSGCIIPGCDLPYLAKDMCKKHSQRVRRTGSPYRLCKKCDAQMPEDSGRAALCDSCKQDHVCAIEGCNRPPQGRGWCKMHWKRWSKHADPLATAARGGHNKKGPCTVPGCERKYHSNGYCSHHRYHYEKYGDPLHVGPGLRSGRKRMEVPSYTGIHKRIFYDRGRAAQYLCVDCGDQAEEWSYNGGCPNEQTENVRGIVMAYSTDQTRYSPRCKKCHRTMDLSSSRERDNKGRFAPTNSPVK